MPFGPNGEWIDPGSPQTFPDSAPSGSTITGNNAPPSSAPYNGQTRFTWNDQIGQYIEQVYSGGKWYDTGNYFDAAGGAGGGGAAGPDHFFDVNPLDQAYYDHTVAQDKIAAELAQNTLALDAAIAERDYALSIGDQRLAQQKQADVNHWEQINAELEQQSQQLTARGQSLDYAANIASIEAQRESGLMEFQAAMANATNDSERNQIQDKWNEQQAHLAVMEDNTRKQIASQQAQISQFGAETDRQVGLGDLGIRHNEFILDAASRPSNLPAMFMMQRGKAPDFQALTSGGMDSVATGEGLAPVNPFNLYTPQVNPLTNFDMGVSSAPIVAGQSAQGAGGNQFIASANQTMQQAQQKSPTDIAKQMLDYLGGAAAPPQRAITQPVKPPEQVVGMSSLRPGTGVPVANLKPGLNKTKVDGDVVGANFTMPAYYDEGKTRPIGRNDIVAHGTDIFVDMPGAASGTDMVMGMGQMPMPAVDATGWLRQQTRPLNGGLINPNKRIGGPMPMTKPPDRIDGPFGGPQTEPWTGPVAVGDDPSGRDKSRLEIAMPRMTSDGRPGIDVMPANPDGMKARIQQMLQQYMQGSGRKPDVWNLANATNGLAPVPNYIEQGMYNTNARTPVPNIYDQRNVLNGWTIPMAATGTDQIMDQWIDQGLGGFYIQDSNNPSVDPNTLPPALRALYDAKFPLAPSTIATSTGTIAPKLNMQRNYASSGLGVAPSLQTLRGQTESENELYKGIVESVGKIPFNDLIQWLGMPTQYLRQAAMAGR